MTDGLVLHPLVGETKGDDVPASVRFEIYETLVERYYPRDRTLLAAFPAAMRYAGPREALFHALVRKNYGITRLIVGRDHAGVGDFYAPPPRRRSSTASRPPSWASTPLRLDPTFHCFRCGTLASSHTCPHGPSARLCSSRGRRCGSLLAAGKPLPKEFTRPEIAEILRQHYGHGHAKQPVKKSEQTGFVLWLTGLSGAGKTTLAEALKRELEPELPVEVLDGDEVRTHLSKGLGFSKEDRDTNVRRIGWVARTLARNGVAVIAAAISPYRDAWQEARELAFESGVPFVEVFVTAPLETLVARDVKGLYRKALAGEIQGFTGVSDPYEAPRTPTSSSTAAARAATSRSTGSCRTCARPSLLVPRRRSGSHERRQSLSALPEARRQARPRGGGRARRLEPDSLRSSRRRARHRRGARASVRKS